MLRRKNEKIKQQNLYYKYGFKNYRITIVFASCFNRFKKTIFFSKKTIVLKKIKNIAFLKQLFLKKVAKEFLHKQTITVNINFSRKIKL